MAGRLHRARRLCFPFQPLSERLGDLGASVPRCRDPTSAILSAGFLRDHHRSHREAIQRQERVVAHYGNRDRERQEREERKGREAIAREVANVIVVPDGRIDPSQARDGALCPHLVPIADLLAAHRTGGSLTSSRRALKQASYASSTYVDDHARGYHVDCVLAGSRTRGQC
jgi:hypothetical protein